MTKSWIVASKATGKAVLETFDPKVVKAINTTKYEVYTSLQWLQKVNRESKTKKK